MAEDAGCTGLIKAVVEIPLELPTAPALSKNTISTLLVAAVVVGPLARILGGTERWCNVSLVREWCNEPPTGWAIVFALPVVVSPPLFKP